MKVAVVMGSDSDFPILKPAVDLLHQFNVETEVIVASMPYRETMISSAAAAVVSFFAMIQLLSSV